MTISIPQISNIIYPRILNSHSKALTKLQTDYSKGQTTVQRGQILEKNGTVFNRHSTDMFRDDINWHFFAKYLNSRYRDDKNVNIYIHACSDGSEAYSMAILCDKYFPKTKKIIAKDISADVIRQNQLRQNRAARTTNRVDKSAQDALDLKNEELDKYFSYSCDTNGNKYIEIRPYVKNMVKFEQANILDDLSSIEQNSPAIIMCRNMWPYVNPDEYRGFVKNLHTVLPGKSIVVIGNYDYTGEIGKNRSDTFPRILQTYFTPAKENIGNFQLSQNLIFEKN